MARLLFVLIGVLAILAAGQAGAAEGRVGRRVALVIGNSQYERTNALANPRRDAAAMGKLFADAGFETVVKADLGVTALRRALADFEVIARDADIAVVYYSGHGLEYGGQNYLVPVDAVMTRAVDVKDEAVPLERVLDAVQGATRLKLVILDACRADPFKALTSTRSANRGLSRIEPTGGNELVAYSAKAGTVAQDGEPGGNSPFTAALLAHLAVPGKDIRLALGKVRDDVVNATHHEQEPFTYGSIGGDEIALVAAAPAVPLAPAAVVRPAGPAADETAWSFIEKSSDAGLFETFIKRFGSSALRSKAEARLAALHAPASTVVAPTPESAVAECDRLAASGKDALRTGSPGVALEDIDVGRAVPACRRALALEPANPRLAFQLGRALSRSSQQQDIQEAAVWYRKAMDEGSIVAMVNLGTMLQRGRGLVKDERQAAVLFRRAADAGSGIGMVSLGGALQYGRGVVRNPVAAAFWYRRAAEKGEPRGMVSMGLLQIRGLGVPRSDTLALQWFRKAADAGDARGMSNLGRMFAQGRGVARNYVEAARWFRRAADAGNVRAMRNLGLMYRNGVGLARDLKQAQFWLGKASSRGDEVATGELSSLGSEEAGLD